MKYQHFKKLRYVIEYPKNYTEGKRYPVVIYLHGAGTRGDSLSLLFENPFFIMLENNPEREYITVAPHCPDNMTWYDYIETLSEFAEIIRDCEFADPNKIYAMGESMGGYGTWQLAMSRPDIISAIVPVCGGGMYWNTERLIGMGVWAFHGAKDGTVLPEESKKMVDSINRFGGNAKLTVYPERDHDAWTDTYNNPEVFKWLLSHSK